MKDPTALTFVIGVRTAEQMTTSSAELMSNLALPKDGKAEAMFCKVEVILGTSGAVSLSF